MPHLLLVIGLLAGPIGAWCHTPDLVGASQDALGLSVPMEGGLAMEMDDGPAMVDGKPVRKHRYKGRRTASKARSSGKRKSGAKAGHGRKGGGVRKTGYASKKKASRKKKSFRSKPRTKKGSSRGGRGR